MRIESRLGFALSALLLSGCSGTLPVAYTAGSAVRGSGEITMGTVRYLPADEKRAKPNQIQNTAMGTVYISTDVASYVRRAFVEELEKSGFKYSASRRLDCDVMKLQADDIGYSVRWSLAVACWVSDGQHGRLTGAVGNVEHKTGKMHSKTTHGKEVARLVTDAYEKILEAPTVRAAIEGRALAAAADGVAPGVTLYASDGKPIGIVSSASADEVELVIMNGMTEKMPRAHAASLVKAR